MNGTCNLYFILKGLRKNELRKTVVPTSRRMIIYFPTEISDVFTNIFFYNILFEPPLFLERECTFSAWVIFWKEISEWKLENITERRKKTSKLILGSFIWSAYIRHMSSKLSPKWIHPVPILRHLKHNNTYYLSSIILLFSIL